MDTAGKYLVKICYLRDTLGAKRIYSALKSGRIRRRDSALRDGLSASPQEGSEGEVTPGCWGWDVVGTGISKCFSEELAFQLDAEGWQDWT